MPGSGGLSVGGLRGGCGISGGEDEVRRVFGELEAAIDEEVGDAVDGVAAVEGAGDLGDSEKRGTG